MLASVSSLLLSVSAFASPQLTGSYIVVVKDRFAVAKCAQRLSMIEGVKIASILRETRLITLTLDNASQEEIGSLRCVKSLESGGQIGIPEDPAADGEVTLTGEGYLALPVEAFQDNAVACAAQLRKVPGVFNIEALNAAGIVTFDAKNASLTALFEAAPCVASVEKSGIVHAQPSTRIGN